MAIPVCYEKKWTDVAHTNLIGFVAEKGEECREGTIVSSGNGSFPTRPYLTLLTLNLNFGSEGSYFK